MAPKLPVAPILVLKPGDGSVVIEAKPGSRGQVDEMIIEKSLTGGGIRFTALATITPRTIFTDSVPNGTKVFYRALAKNSTGAGPYSAEAHATPNVLLTAVQNLQASSQRGVVTATWDSASGIPTAYRFIWWKTGETLRHSRQLPSDDREESFITDGGEYVIEVTPLRDNEEGPISTITARTKGGGITLPRGKIGFREILTFVVKWLDMLVGPIVILAVALLMMWFSIGLYPIAALIAIVWGTIVVIMEVLK